jgi:UDP-N-acetylmuramoylalanine--D-glutamate ligase
MPVLGEIELAYRLIKPAMIAAITGTNGKTTTTTLVGEIFKAAGHKTLVAGNIGSPLAASVNKVDGRTAVVLEMSSYQLEDTYDFRPRISAILNITPDHIEHHKTMAKYALAKSRIFVNQGASDHCVLNYECARTKKLAGKCRANIIYLSSKRPLKKGVYYKNGEIFVMLPRNKFSFKASLKIPGMHNIENALAATAITAAAGIKKSIIESTLNRFSGVEHRIEYVSTVAGVDYINDSKGTNVDSTLVALKSFNRPVWLILGGRDKGSPYAPLKTEINSKVKAVLLIGEAANKIKKELTGITEFYETKNIGNALKIARKNASPGDVVLLSPACASFDQFNNYEERGSYFKKLVKQLPNAK